MTSTMNLDFTTEQLDAYRQNGFTHLHGVFSADEVAACDAECSRLLAAEFIHEDNLRSRFRTVDGERIIERIDPVIDVSPVFDAMVRDERVLGPLRAIFGDEPKLFKDKLIFKLPGMSGYTMHQDQAWWQLCPADDILSVLIVIDGADASNGGIEVFSGYHDKLRTPEGELRNFNDDEAAQIDESRGVLPVTKPGDVVIFHSQTPHRSGPNTAIKSRRSLYLTYNAARVGDLYQANREHYWNYSQRTMGEEEKARLFFR